MYRSDFRPGKYKGPYVERKFSTDGLNVLLSEYHYDSRGWPHREPEDGPAITENYPDGTPALLEYRWHGLLHRDGAPATLAYHDNGVVDREGWYRFGRCHRRGAPAWILRKMDGLPTEEVWYLHDYDFRDPRIGPYVLIYSDAGEPSDKIFSDDIPPRPEPPLKWLRKTLGEKGPRFEA